MSMRWWWTLRVAATLTAVLAVVLGAVFPEVPGLVVG